MHYIGVDYHKRYSYIVVKNENGEVEGRGSLSNTKEKIRQFLQPYGSGTAVIEATRNWRLIYDWLEEILDDVALAHPLKVKAIAEVRIKTDKISADILADLLRTGLLSRAYAPSKQTREFKNILRQLALDDLVFANVEGRPIDPGVLSHSFARLVKRVGLENVRFHELRHTFASLALRQGIHPKIVSEALGHASVGFTMDTYSHIIQGMQAEAMVRLGDILPQGRLLRNSVAILSPPPDIMCGSAQILALGA
jgi:hypothetical protein